MDEDEDRVLRQAVQQWVERRVAVLVGQGCSLADARRKVLREFDQEFTRAKLTVIDGGSGSE